MKGSYYFSRGISGVSNIMKKKSNKRKIIVYVCSILAGGIIAASIMKNLNIMTEDSLLGQAILKKMGKMQTKEEEEEEGETLSQEVIDKIQEIDDAWEPYTGKYEKLSSYLDRIEVLEHEKTVNYLGFVVEIKDMYITKKADGFPQCPFDTVSHDKDGKLQNNMSYVVLDVNIKHIKSDDVRTFGDEIYLNNMYLELFTKAQDYIGSCEAVSCNNYKTFEEGGKEFFKQKLSIGESIDRRIAFLVNDEDIEDAIITLDVNFSGILQYALDVRKCVILRK